MPATPPTPDSGDPAGQSGPTEQQSGPTEQQSGPTEQQSGPTEGPHDRLLTDLRALRRAREGRVIAGVCAGVGRHVQVDPVVLRVVLVVLTLFGGVGVLLYGAGWILMPSDDDERSIIEQQLGRRNNGSPDRSILIGGLIVLGLVVMSVPWWGFPWHVPTLLILSLLALVALIRRGSDHGGNPAAPTPDPAAGPDGAATYVPGTYVPGTLSGSAPAGTFATMRDASVPAPDGPAEPVRSWRSSEPAPAAFWDQPDPLGLEIAEIQLDEVPEGWTPPPPPVRREPKRRSWLLAGTLLAATLMLMVVAATDGSHDVPYSAYVAAPLGVVGLGLILGTWFGRTRALMALGILLALALVPVTASQSWTDESVDMTIRPVSVGGIQPSYDFGAGGLVLDLSELTFPEDRQVSTSVDMGAGDVTILLPRDVDAHIAADVGLGEVVLFGGRYRGVAPPPAAEEESGRAAGEARPDPPSPVDPPPAPRTQSRVP